MAYGITFIAIIHILVALLLIGLVLLQDGKGGGVGGSFGGGSSQTLFGATGAANFLVKATRVLAVVFMLSCIALAVLMSRGTTRSVVDSGPASTSVPAPTPSAADTGAGTNANPSSSTPTPAPSPGAAAPVTK
jgi:preprotein translocase subunit SecG